MIRPFRESDISFVKNSWLMGFLKSHGSGPLSSHNYFAAYSPQLDSLLENCTTLVACNEEDQDQIYGYLCYEPAVSMSLYDPAIKRPRTISCPVVHFTHVKMIFEGHGIARELWTAAHLFEAETITYTFSTKDGRDLARHYTKTNIIFNPTPARRF